MLLIAAPAIGSVLASELTPISSTGHDMTEHSSASPLVGIIMGSRSDWDTMRSAAEILQQFGIAHECRVVSAHRTPDWMSEYAKTAQARGLKVIIAGAGGAAHLPGMVASLTSLPVLGVPVQSKALSGLDSLLSIVQMPGGVPVGTLAIGSSGAKNAGLLAIRILATSSPALLEQMDQYRAEVRDEVLKDSEI
jgi:5-(carboxyamino)imidazole ribonucleotide mutase